jgi:hypothetical protein
MIRHFYKQSSSLEPRDQIQYLALAEYLWQKDYDYSPFATWRGNVMNAFFCPYFELSISSARITP